MGFRPIAFAVLALSACLVTPAAAAIGTSDDVPAATLLLPYFEVDFGNPDGITTLFSVNNASATAVLAHVVLWSDLSVPVLDFNLYLTGYDVQTINLRDILVNGVLPQTASDGQDPTDLVSPQGAFSQDVNFASCSGQLPLPNLPEAFLAHLRAALTGRFSNILGGCAGLSYGDNVARGYVTVDAVNNCTLRFPGDSGYFVSGGTGDASDQNVLWGDLFYVDVSTDRAEGEALVHVEASAADPSTSTSGQYTFYSRYVSWTAVDNRERLGAELAARYLNGGPFTGGTDLLVWRDSKVKQGAFTCGTVPAWYPLGEEGIVIFDEEEHASPASFPFSPQPPEEGLAPFPAEAQRVTVGGPALPVPFPFGWLFLDLNTVVAAAGAVPPIDPGAAQAWVGLSIHTTSPYAGVVYGKGGIMGRASVGFAAIQLGSGHFHPH
ncbi:MAG TPA: hypothetical protein VMM92_10735 [Thermoanaerobaculia bacterium]|nr:hypothetical protein [Thermoanaerobaculia bacterium]